MLFQFINFSQFVVSMFGYKTIYKVTNLKVLSNGRYFVLKKIPFQELQRTARLDYKSCFRVFATSHIVNPAYGNSTGWGGAVGSIIEPLYTKFLALVNAFRLHIPYCINNVMKFMFKYKKCNIEKYKLFCVAELINGTRCAAQTSQTMFFICRQQTNTMYLNRQNKLVSVWRPGLCLKT